jgi:hypothetical protein
LDKFVDHLATGRGRDLVKLAFDIDALSPELDQLLLEILIGNVLLLRVGIFPVAFLGPLQDEIG